MPVYTFDDQSIVVQVMGCAARQGAIACASIDPDLCHRMVLLGRNILI